MSRHKVLESAGQQRPYANGRYRLLVLFVTSSGQALGPLAMAHVPHTLVERETSPSIVLPHYHSFTLGIPALGNL